MADRKEPVRRATSAASPGVGGAIKDAIDALSKSFAPKAITQRKQKINQAVDKADLGDQF